MAEHEFFEGWYFKHQCGGRTIALIPAHHRHKDGGHQASLQIITQRQTWYLPIPAAQFQVERRPFLVRAGDCSFSLQGLCVDCPLDGGRLTGELRYQNVVPPRYDIMGPFCAVPGMECRHSVLSLAHRVSGTLRMEGDTMDFTGGTGYIEGDRGLSFPKRYLWTQCGWGENCVMLSVADIPFCGGTFIGCICSVLLEGRERRLATYTGARVLRVDETGALVRQRDWELEVTLVEARGQRLQAPKGGGMTRTIHESAACRVRYRLRRGGKTLLDFTGDMASFEAEWIS
ncbi:MAG: hypothetical protein RR350_08930 [Oscillibacter sp.]